MKETDIEKAYRLKQKLDYTKERRAHLNEGRPFGYVEIAYRACAPCEKDKFHIEIFSDEFIKRVRLAFCQEYDRIIAELQHEIDTLL